MMQATDKQTSQRSNKDSKKRETSQFAEALPNSLFFYLLPTSKKGNGLATELLPEYALFFFFKGGQLTTTNDKHT